jgi:hydrogenase nickel incorporation protein HypA/HybF
MHEFSLCQGIVDSLAEAAQRQNFSRVRGVQLEIGALAGVDEEALRFAFELVSRDTLAAGATLDIVIQPGSAWCEECRQTVTINQYYDPCPHCAGHRLRVQGGEQLKITQAEVE